MNQGITTVIYPARDIVKSKVIFRELLGAEPYANTSYCVGF